MRTLQIATGLLFAAVMAASCTRDNDVIEPAKDPIGGKGGNNKLEVTPKHHGKDITSATIYIKYDALRAPVDGKYDDSAFLPINGGMTAVFDSLKWGNYFLYCNGFDASPTVNEDVAGIAAFRAIDSSKLDYKTTIEVTEVSGDNHQ